MPATVPADIKIQSGNMNIWIFDIPVQRIAKAGEEPDREELVIITHTFPQR